MFPFTHAHSPVRVDSRMFASHHGRFEDAALANAPDDSSAPQRQEKGRSTEQPRKLKAAAAGEDGASEKFTTDRRHLHHVNTTDKMFLSAPRRKQSAFMADTEQRTARRNYSAIRAGIGEAFEAGVAPDVRSLLETKPVRTPVHALHSTLCAPGAKVEKQTRSRLAPGEIRPGEVPAPREKKKVI